MSEPLDQQTIDEALNNLAGWSHENDKLHKEFEFDNFRESMAFITLISYEAEEQVHHPEIFNVYSTVKISLTTHDAGGKVTDKDLELAKSIEEVSSKI